MPHEVYRAKLRRPPPAGLVRERLLTLVIGADGPPVTVVVAPAGSGKTTLLGQVAAHAPWSTAWYSAGPEDRFEEGLVRHLAEASTSAAAGLASDVRTLHDLVAVLEALDAPLLLIMDDVHELLGSESERAVERLVRLRPDQLRLVLSARRPLSLNVPRLRLSGELTYFDSESLRFRSWEVEELFRAVFGAPLRPEAAAALTRRIGGWAAGLQLFHLATAGMSAAERDRAVTELGGRSRLLRSYLTRNVLDGVAPERRHFLMVTSTLGVLTGPLCDALLNTAGSATVLDELESQQFFIAVSEDGRSYRYHQVLATHLEAMLRDDVGPQQAAELHARSGALLEAAGHRSEAMRSYALADDWGSVARLIQTAGAGPPVTYPDPAGAADPPDDDPWLALVRARRLLRNGSIRRSVEAYRDAELQLDDPEFRARCADERDLAAVWLPDPLNSNPRPGHSLGQIMGLACAVRRLTRQSRGDPAPTDAEPAPSHPLVDGIAALLDGDTDAAAQALAASERSSTLSSFERLATALCSVLGQMSHGDADSLVPRMEGIALTGDLEEQPWLARVARALLQGLLIITRPESWRDDACRELEAECRSAGDEWGALLVCTATGVAHSIEGDRTAATEWAERAARYADALDAPALRRFAIHSIQPRAERQQDARKPGPQLPDVALRCLGWFSLTIDGREIDLRGLRPLPRSLMQMLAIEHGHDVHREVLIEALWPGTAPDVAAHRLHVAASSIRGALSSAGLRADWLSRRGESYCLDVPGVVWDVAEFESCCQTGGGAAAEEDVDAAAAAWTDALSWYRGDLLTEAGPADWVVEERDRLRLKATEAALAATKALVDAGRGADALPLAHRAVALDPSRDSTLLLLAEVQSTVGDQRAAAATRRRYHEVAGSLAVVVPRPRRAPLGAGRGRA
jgi:DNA-binding SARP family transcriptional activator